MAIRGCYKNIIYQYKLITMNFLNFKKIISDLQCQINTLKQSIASAIKIFFKGNLIEEKAISIDFTGSGVESVTTDAEGDVVVTITDTQSDWLEEDSLENSFIQNKPTPIDLIFTGNVTTTQTGPSEITVDIGEGISGWSLIGNSGTNSSINFIGTTDDNDFIIKRNNIQVGKFTSSTIYLCDYSGNNNIDEGNSIFIGLYSGENSTTNSCNFIGYFSGNSSTVVEGVNFIGANAGTNCDFIARTNFIGSSIGNSSSNIINCNFIGYNTASNSSNILSSNIIGHKAGVSLFNTSYSNLIGYNVGSSFTGNNIGNNNIIIGTNISLPNGAENSINLGAVLFATGTHSLITAYPSITPTINGKVGIGVVTPTAVLDLRASTTAEAIMRLRVGVAPTTPNDGDIWYDGTDLKMRIGGITKTFVMT